MRKAFFRLMGLVLGLSVFTACYGPAPGGWEYDEAEEAVTGDTKATEDGAAVTGEEAAQAPAPAEAAAEPAK
ncbi:MAG: hypothetical protein J5737_03020 [Bacteroidales bacterium]|nr:hypothetical protein [Bacteroidales bacterium]